MASEIKDSANGPSGSQTKPTNEESGLVEAKVKLPADAMEFLRAEAAAHNVTMGEILRIALGTHKFLKEKVDSGAKVQVRERNRTLDVTL